MSVDFPGTAAIVRRALERSFTGSDPRDAVWRGLVGPGLREVEVDLQSVGGHRAAVHLEARVVEGVSFDAAVARAVLLENDHLILTRLRHRDDAVIVEQTVLGGPTLDVQEARIAAWSVGWVASEYADRVAARIAGRPLGALPVPRVDARRGAEERVASTRERVERFLRETYGSFEDDPAWGYHGGFGSTRVFCSVRHYLESSTVVVVGSPVLSDVELTDELALDAHAIAAREPFGRFSLAEDRRELWFEHAVLGDDLDPDELRTAIDAVARVADAEDDRLQAAHGGRRYADL